MAKKGRSLAQKRGRQPRRGMVRKGQFKPKTFVDRRAQEAALGGEVGLKRKSKI